MEVSCGCTLLWTYQLYRIEEEEKRLLMENMTKEEKLAKLVEKAKELGATDAKIIRVDTIRTGAWTRWKCQFGCPNYGKRWTCPPRVPGYEETQRFLAEYTDGMLVQFTCHLTSEDIANYDEKDRITSNKIGKIMVDLEREAFLLNWYKAFGMKGGTCRLCETCNEEHCNHPREARPSMEAVGIDVFAFARDHGYPADVIDSSCREFKIYCLLLID